MLSILIPTYNRGEFLLKNLQIIYSIVKKSGLLDNVTIIISDNCSPDDTGQIIEGFCKNHPDIRIKAFEQQKNIGLKANALFVLEHSTDEYVMYIGDDDFISYKYLINCIDIIKKDKDLSVIIPNFVAVSVDGDALTVPRDVIKPVQFYKPGFKALYENSWKGHQLSGLTLKREGLLDSYLKYRVDNIYLFIFFTGISCLTGNIYHITDSPVEVTQPVKKKDWGYGDDGLINEVFDNYRKLPVTYFQRFALEMHFMRLNMYRLLMYKSQGKKALIKAFRKITFAKNATILFSFIYPLYLSKVWMKNLLKGIEKQQAN